MFTGIVEELGEVTAVEDAPTGARVTVRAPTVTSDAEHGDSIAVNGVCLTVTELRGDGFTVDVVHETLVRSTLSRLGQGTRVNLERATAAGARLGGHIMQGHVDGKGTFLTRDVDGFTTFALPRELGRYVVRKGSIAVDGISLTVASVDADEFGVALIPTTLELTTLGTVEPGDEVNLEVDVLAKYVEKLATAHLPGAAGDNGSGEEDQ